LGAALTAPPVRAGQLKAWPAGMWLIVRRERPHPRAQLSLFEEADGYRDQLSATNTHPSPGARSGWGRSRSWKPGTGPTPGSRTPSAPPRTSAWATCPPRGFEINRAWCLAVAIACDLLVWLRLLCLTGDLARAEPKTLRYRLLHTAARPVRANAKRKIASRQLTLGPANSGTPSPPP
jgi:Transposase DDE domain group 1